MINFKKQTELKKLEDAYNALCDSHNDLCKAHDELVEQFTELYKGHCEVVQMIDALTEIGLKPLTKRNN